ncbi:MAG: chemotaxis protein CheX [Candidatus Synoicihabitans palmerolidicus]|nr:chemotaxis protein CheX [Candidatus Synoicihabitans palmerolidicus]
MSAPPCLALPSDCQGIIPGEKPGGVSDGEYVVGSVGFVGDINGIIYLRLPIAFANYATGKTLGMTSLEIAADEDDLLKEVIGELTHMTVGSFKNVLCDSGHPCMLTLPTIIRASQLGTGTARCAHREVYHYDCAWYHFTADIQVRAD